MKQLEIVNVSMPWHLKPITVTLPFLDGVEIIAEDHARFQREVGRRLRFALGVWVFNLLLLGVVILQNFLRALAFWWGSR